MLGVGKKYKILIVDDSRLNRLVMSSMLSNDYLLEEACDGEEAMLILQDRKEEFSLVLLDIVMPNIDGLALLKLMQEHGWLDLLPVIMISSEYTAENIDKAYLYGASDVIRRPYDEKVICHRIANTIALSSKNRRLSNALADEIIKENNSNEAMISILSHIVETRNGESGAHVQNIRHITEMLLQELLQKTDRYSFTKDEMLRIAVASSLHDIGKMSVPEEILNKPGKLTDEEFRIIKGHTIAGANMVEPLLQKSDANPLIQMTYEICRWHHERYDGHGYPDGLKGEEIPIAAQIVSVADVYDALTSERCYKPSFSPDQAIQMICNGECGAFNPVLLDCLTAIIDELKKTPSDSNELEEIDKNSNRMVMNALARTQENGLFSSGRIMEKLTCERLRFKFFFDEAFVAFYYTVSPPALHLNKLGRELLKTNDFIVDSNQELTSYAGYDRHTQERLINKLATATNESPLVQEELLLVLPGKAPQRYLCMMQTIWDSPDAKHYEEVAGRLIPMDGDAVKLAPAESLDEFHVNGSAMTSKEARHLINALKFMIYNVRLVDPSSQRVIEFGSDGKLIKGDHSCFALWNQDCKCENCTSGKCLKSKEKFSKIVLFENEVFYVISQYITVDGIPLVLEGLIRITNDAMTDQDGNTLSISDISSLSSKLYLDPLTNVYNRRYYDAKAKELKNICALAIINVDNFKNVNETYGRTIGDNTLIHIAKAIEADIRTPDTLVRYDGDEFVIIFEAIDEDAFRTKLNNICNDIATLSIDGFDEGQHITASIGGAIGPALPDVLLKRADEKLQKAKKNQGTTEI